MRARYLSKCHACSKTIVSGHTCNKCRDDGHTDLACKRCAKVKDKKAGAQ